MAKKSVKARRSPANHASISPALLQDVLTTLDACEQLLDLLRGILNGGDEWYGDDLIVTFIDRVIVATRIQLAKLLPSTPPRVPRRDGAQ